jgi:hypothetical protein
MSWMRSTCKLGRFSGLALLFLGCLGTGCGDDTQNPPRTEGSVAVQLDHSVSGQPLVFQDRRYTNAAGNHYDIYELRYYISNLRLVGRTAGAITLGDTHYRDAADAATRTWKFDAVPNGEYVAMRFTFGLDSLLNVTGGLPLTNENFAMAWPPDLGGGYHLMMLDGTFAGSSANDPWLAHLGRLKRSTDAVASGGSFEVELDFLAPPCPTCPAPSHGLIVDNNDTEIQLVMDLDQWFTTPRVYDFAVYGANVMSNPAAQNDLHANGADAFGLGTVTGVRP